jgi:hypothetical protein
MRSTGLPTVVWRASDVPLNLAGDGITKDAIARGQMIVDPYLHAPTDRIDSIFKLLGTESKPVGQWMPVRLHHREMGGNPQPGQGDGELGRNVRQSIYPQVAAHEHSGGRRHRRLRSALRHRRQMRPVPSAGISC